MLRRLWAWLVGWRAKGDVTRGWLQEQTRRELASGWEGPRWRSPKEIARMRETPR